jgi:hypothetical protein
MAVERCCSRPSSHLAQVRVPLGSGWAVTDVIKVNEIATGSGVITRFYPLRRRNSEIRASDDDLLWFTPDQQPTWRPAIEYPVSAMSEMEEITITSKASYTYAARWGYNRNIALLKS